MLGLDIYIGIGGFFFTLSKERGGKEGYGSKAH